ncbi:ABC1 kinase family protein [Camelliibacillus cellulosilyticus]|uniref:ABC1 kinase family protein n=1 Tax=Camelliibacillus cellulosilyticus TaxID=2174486 RepID=A0ABV9GKB6_9BACL
MFIKRMQHLNRYREIAIALIKYGFGYIVKDVGLFPPLSLPKRLVKDLNKEREKPVGKRLRLLMEELGPTFIKLGQLLSIRRDLVPEPIADELEKLQDEVTPISGTAIQQIIEEEFGAPIQAIFQSFDSVCLAAASVGQVHQAVLKTGETVAVKVRRPHIESRVETDLEILQDLTRIVEQHYDWAKHYQLSDIVDELAEAIRHEMDYTHEARNTERIKRQFEDSEEIVIPKVYWDYSTKRVLTTSYIHGKKFSDLKGLDPDQYNRKKLAKRLVDSFLSQVLISGVYHGDPHPGNLFFLPGERIAYIDFGQIGVLNSEMKRNFASLIIGLMRRDTDMLVHTVCRMALAPDDINEVRLHEDLDILRDKYSDIPLSQINIGDAITDLFNTTQKHHIPIPKDYTLLGKALITLEGIITDLDSELSLIQLAEPFGQKLLLERFNPGVVVSKLWDELTDFTTMVFRLPRQLRQTLQKIDKGQVRFEMGLPKMEHLMSRLDRVGNRIAFSIIFLAASIILVGLIIGQTFGNPFLTHFPAVKIGSIVVILMFIGLVYTLIKK